jgi:hypothetical protein
MNPHIALALAALAVFAPLAGNGIAAERQGAFSQTDAAAEKAKIEALIAHLGGLKGATFIRNDSGYDSKTAAKFLRRKWEANEKEIKTAADFIAKAATKSSTTGKPYMIRIDGVDMPCADYLKAQLKKLDSAPGGK